MARVLVVEDEEVDRTILGNLLERAGHEVHLAEDGEQALRIYWTRSIEVAVTDLHMPHVDGLEFIETLRASFPKAAIIAVSGKGPDLLAEARSKGALLALSKPVDPHELLEAVAEAACIIPARKAAGIDPADALRSH